MRLSSILAALVLILGTAVSHASQVLKISGNPKFIAVSHSDGRRWEIGDDVCVVHDSEEVACGKIRKTGSKAAIMEITKRRGEVTVDDEVVLKNAVSENRSRKSKEKAHSKETPPTLGGIHLGASMASLYIDPPQTSSSKIGLVGGIEFDFPVFGFFFDGYTYFHPELHYIQKGNKGDGGSIAVDYIEIPLLAKFRFGQGPFHFNVQLGPFIAMLMGAKINVDGGTATDFKANSNSLDFGFTGGIGGEYLVGKDDSIFMTIRYGMGFTNILNIDTLVFSNQGFVFLLGYNLNLGKLF